MDKLTSSHCQNSSRIPTFNVSLMSLTPLWCQGSIWGLPHVGPRNLY